MPIRFPMPLDSLLGREVIVELDDVGGVRLRGTVRREVHLRAEDERIPFYVIRLVEVLGHPTRLERWWALLRMRWFAARARGDPDIAERLTSTETRVTPVLPTYDVGVGVYRVRKWKVDAATAFRRWHFAEVSRGMLELALPSEELTARPAGQA